MNPSPQSPPPAPPADTPGRTFFRQAAMFSLFATPAAILINLFRLLVPTVSGSRAATLLFSLTAVLLIVMGLGLGIAALAAVRRYGRAGILTRAIVGTCLNGLFVLLMLISLPTVIKVVQKAKEKQQQQQMNQRGP